MPEGTVVKLPAAAVEPGHECGGPEGGHREDHAAELHLRGLHGEEFAGPYRLEDRHASKGKKDYKLRMINLYFVARGKWDVLTSKEFGDNILKQKKEDAKKQGGGAMTAGFLTDKEMAKRGLKTVTGKHGGDSYFYSTFSLCDMVEVSAMRYAVLNETPERRCGGRPPRSAVCQGPGLSQPVAAHHQGRLGRARAGHEDIPTRARASTCR